MEQPPIEQQVAFLRQVPLLHGLDDNLLGGLAGVMLLTREPAGKELCRQGGPGNAVFIIGHGEVEVVVSAATGERVLATLGACHVVGEVALIDGKRRSATIRCKTDVSVFTLMRSEFDRLLGSGNAASMRLLDNIARDLVARVRAVNNRYTEIFSQAGATIETLSRDLAALRVETESVDAGDADKDLLELVGYKPIG